MARAPNGSVLLSTRVAALVAALAAVLAAPLAACESKGGGSPLRERTEAPSAEALGKWIELWIPPSATAYRSHAESWQDWVVLARFELPGAELESFLARNQLVPSAAAIPAPPTKQAWFQPAAAAHAFTPAPPADAAARPPRFSKVLWISEAGGRAEVYLRATDR